jgi:hypothetical protein
VSAWASLVVSPTNGKAHLLAVEGAEFLTTQRRLMLPRGGLVRSGAQRASVPDMLDGLFRV